MTADHMTPAQARVLRVLAAGGRLWDPVCFWQNLYTLTDAFGLTVCQVRRSTVVALQLRGVLDAELSLKGDDR